MVSLRKTVNLTKKPPKKPLPCYKVNLRKMPRADLRKKVIV